MNKCDNTHIKNSADLAHQHHAAQRSAINNIHKLPSTGHVFMRGERFFITSQGYFINCPLKLVYGAIGFVLGNLTLELRSVGKN